MGSRSKGGYKLPWLTWLMDDYRHAGRVASNIRPPRLQVVKRSRKHRRQRRICLTVSRMPGTFPHIASSDQER